MRQVGVGPLKGSFGDVTRTSPESLKMEVGWLMQVVLLVLGILGFGRW